MNGSQPFLHDNGSTGRQWATGCRLRFGLDGGAIGLEFSRLAFASMSSSMRPKSAFSPVLNTVSFTPANQ
jgi:hypothetical protein